MLRVGLAELRREDSLAREREDVAGAGVVEGHRAGERAGDHQQLEHEREATADVRVGERVPGGGVLALELVGDGLRSAGLAPAADEHQAHEDVEDAEADDGGVRRDLGDALGVLGLLRVVRRHLEADPAPERAEERDADRRGAEDLHGGVVVEEVRGLRPERAMPSGPPPSIRMPMPRMLSTRISPTSATPSTFAVSSMSKNANTLMIARPMNEYT